MKRKRLTKMFVSFLLTIVIVVSQSTVALAAHPIVMIQEWNPNTEKFTIAACPTGFLPFYILLMPHTWGAKELVFQRSINAEYAHYEAPVLGMQEFISIKSYYTSAEKINMSNVQLVNDEIPENAFFYPGPFSYGHGLKEFWLDVDNDINKIGDWAFHKCSNLTMFYSTGGKFIDTDEGKVYRPSAVVEFGTGAFSECTSLEFAGLRGTQIIGNNAFYNCTSLIENPALGAYSTSVQTIGTYAFYNCDSLPGAVFSEADTLGAYAFAECDSLENASFSSLTAINYGTFQNCIALTDGYFPEATFIDDYAFFNDSNLRNITIPKVQTINSGSFMNNTSLTSLTLENLQSIGIGAFENCSSLTSLTLGATVPTVAANAFSGLPENRTLYVPISARSAYDPDLDGKWMGWTLSELNHDSDILSFSFDEFSPRRVGVIANTNWIWITVPYGTDLSSLTPTINISPLADVYPASGEAVDFTNSVTNDQSDLVHYTVRAEDSSTTKHYYIHIAEAPSDAKDIVSFSFNNLSPAVAGVIDQGRREITITVPHNQDVTSLVPAINHLQGSSILPASGIAQDFTNPLEYTTTATDGSTKTYSVTVENANQLPKIITGITNNTAVDQALNTSYNVDLSSIFEDADGDSLTYSVSVDNAVYSAVNASYGFTPTQNGQVILNFKANDGYGNSFDTYAVTLATGNNIPNRKAGVSATSNATTLIHTAYTLDLSTIFEDADGDNLFYYHSVDGGQFNITSKDFTYTPTITGFTTLSFKVNDGASDSTDTYEVILEATTNYDITYNLNGGTNNAGNPVTYSSQSSTIIFADPTRAGYRFRGWYDNENLTGDTVAQIPSGSTSDVALWAKWTVQLSGNKEEKETEISIINSDGSTMTGKLTTTNSGARVELPRDAFNKMAEDSDGKVSINLGIGTVTFNGKAVDSISGSADDGDISFGIKEVNTSSLSANALERIGDRPVYDFTLIVGKTQISNLGGSATINIPYTLRNGEDPNAVVVYYIDDSGELQIVEGGYNSETGTVDFTVTHFSVYAVGYNETTFTDVSENSWYYDAVTFCAAREITTGTGDDMFSPDSTLTRGQFIVMLMRAYGIEADEDATDNFDDAGETYFTGYLAAAKRFGISNGVGNNMFAPESEITRQDMFTLLYRVLDVLGKLPKDVNSGELSGYTDAGEIADYAKEAMEAFVASGIVSGSDGKLDPSSNSTRSQMVQVLYNLFSV